MRQGWKIALVVVLIAAAGGFAWWQQRRRDDAEATAAALAEASDAMKQLNAQDERFPPAFRRAMSSLPTDLLLDPARAGERLRSTLVPMVDEYLVTIDRAVRISDIYLARAPDQSVAANLERIRKRAEAVRAFRGKLGEVQAQIARGALTDEISSTLTAAGFSLLLSDLPSK